MEPHEYTEISSDTNHIFIGKNTIYVVECIFYILTYQSTKEQKQIWSLKSSISKSSKCTTTHLHYLQIVLTTSTVQNKQYHNFKVVDFNHKIQESSVTHIHIDNFIVFMLSNPTDSHFCSRVGKVWQALRFSSITQPIVIAKTQFTSWWVRAIFAPLLQLHSSVCQQSVHSHTP